MKEVKRYICLHPLIINSPIGVKYPDDCEHILGLFKTKKSAQKYGKNVLEVYMQVNTHY